MTAEFNSESLTNSNILQEFVMEVLWLMNTYGTDFETIAFSLVFI